MLQAIEKLEDTLELDCEKKSVRKIPGVVLQSSGLLNNTYQ